MIEVKKKDNESVGGLLRRFTRKIQQSELLRQARDSRFKTRDKSRNLRRRHALKRNELAGIKARDRKLGKLDEEFTPRYRR